MRSKRPCRSAAPLKDVVEGGDFRQFWDESYKRLDFYLAQLNSKERRKNARRK
jgi:hypothetical protein